MIVLHGAVSIGVGTGGLREPVPTQYYAMIKELTVIKD